MAQIQLTVQQIRNLGLWDKVCEYKGWNPWILNEGRISEDDLVEFDDTFEKEKPMNVYSVSVNFSVRAKSENEAKEKVEKIISGWGKSGEQIRGGFSTKVEEIK